MKAQIHAHLEKQKLLIKRALHNERTFLRKIGIKLQEKVYKMEEALLGDKEKEDKEEQQQ
jgi:hypothetical protein